MIDSQNSFMQTIFLSHSKKDTAVVSVFRQAFDYTQLRPILMEYENVSSPAWRQIKQNIQGASALFVLLGANLKSSDYTQNWVSYEIGVADAAGREIWVFEDVHSEVIFPLPNAHHYVLYDANNTESMNYLTNIIKSYALNLKAGVGLGGLTYLATKDELAALLVGVFGTKVGVPRKPIGTTRTCYHDTCKLTFQYHNLAGTFKCPSCRQPLTFFY